MTLLAFWFGIGMIVVGGGWVNPKRAFLADYLWAMFLLTTWPFLLILETWLRGDEK